MGNFSGKKRRRKVRSYTGGVLLLVSLLFVFVCYQNMSETGKAPAVKQVISWIKEEIAVGAFKNCMMIMITEKDQEQSPTLGAWFLEKLEQTYPVCQFSETMTEYNTRVESDLAGALLAENEREGEKSPEEQGGQETPEEQESQETPEEQKTEESKTEEKKEDEQEQAETSVDAEGKALEISREKLNDFDYLVQNFYQIDRTTTIDSSQLNADALLGKSMKLEKGAENVQILIYHTHSQEGYADSTPGDTGTGVVGVAEYLTTLLREKGYNVMHHTGEYDVKDRDNAYSYAGPALEQILAENPEIEVVIDLHRDGVADTTRLVSEVNGKQTAQIMFFNGLSRTTSNGDIAYLANPFLADNLAFSFQLKLAAEEYYPGFARANYLKGYRYNLHYRPKSLLVEVGAQTNTLEEAMNAMEPLADILHKVLSE